MANNYVAILEKLKNIEQHSNDSFVIKEAKQIRLLIEDMQNHQTTKVESLRLENEYLLARCDILDDAISDVLHGKQAIIDENSKT